MSLNQKQINIKNLLKSYSIETTPNVYDKYGKFSNIVPLNNSIYVTYLPDENAKRVIETSKKLNEEGYDVIPHLPARTIKNISDLEKFIGALSEKAGCKKILVVTGKGTRSKTYDNPYVSDKLSKLRYSIPEFIKNDEILNEKVQKVVEADIKDGGEGAIYIFLKNNKNL